MPIRECVENFESFLPCAEFLRVYTKSVHPDYLSWGGRGAAPFSQRSACEVAELQMAFTETFLFRREVIPLFILTFFSKDRKL